MPMQLRIVHTTGFEYDGKAQASFNEVRMTPQTGPGQIVVHDRLDAHPTPWQYSYRDYWGSQVTAFEILDPHESLTLTATATVHTDRPEQPGPTLGWEQVAEVADEFHEFLTVDPRVAPPEDLAASCEEIRRTSATPGEAARRICDLVYSEVKYVSGSTDVRGHAADAWKARNGVCQDMAHLVIGGLRHIGVPARYVSGYMHPKADPVVGETVRGESHAWVEWWDEGWIGFDPTNDQEPGDRHVVVSTGRDYADVKPLSGIFTGGKTSRMFVDVQITRLQ